MRIWYRLNTLLCIWYNLKHITHIPTYPIQIKHIITHLIRLKTHFTHQCLAGATPSDLANLKALGGRAYKRPPEFKLYLGVGTRILPLAGEWSSLMQSSIQRHNHISMEASRNAKYNTPTQQANYNKMNDEAKVIWYIKMTSYI